MPIIDDEFSRFVSIERNQKFAPQVDIQLLENLCAEDAGARLPEFVKESGRAIVFFARRWFS